MVKNRYKKSFGDFLYFSETCIFIQNKELLPTGISFPKKNKKSSLKIWFFKIKYISLHRQTK